MSRPTYETPQDRAAAERIGKVVADSWGLSLFSLKAYFEIDFALVKDRALHSWLEVKCRNSKPHNHYATLMLSIHKFSEGKRLAVDTGLQFYFAVEFSDGIYYHPINLFAPYMVSLMGRNDRGDSADIEPCILIPYQLLKPL